ncbi:uncharacterized protein GGS22DRAFT_154106 [Annulohypoxylon maeteangense]|uniref:uncharacterized protein n=1 Tax=Annulohypoxylon maeteangense TaxID=1927788 RepID=UPI0020086020|nr:uncharacterized protein GGS22DRAFT_154106 [Annulohypoxylon maeteangense]KAI0887722.1 hypothetical protein GGS22DRAFT_154106 [Annulohypoxylon maeteangense]
MPWATNPLFKPSTAEATADVEAAAANNSGSNLDPSLEPSSSAGQEIPSSVDDGFKEPTEKFTAHQIFYIFILDGIGAMILSGGINFAIAYAMYATQDIATRPIRLWLFPNTLAGDAAVTVIIQCLITWHIELFLVNRDLRKGGVHPIGFIPEPKNKLMRWFMFLDRPKQTHEVRSIVHWLGFLRSQILRSMIIAVVCFPFIWGPSIGFLVLAGRWEGNDWYYDRVWAPQVFKLIQGGVLGLLTTPPMVIFWLTRCGWALKNNEERYGER